MPLEYRHVIILPSIDPRGTPHVNTTFKLIAHVITNKLERTKTIGTSSNHTLGTTVRETTVAYFRFDKVLLDRARTIHSCTEKNAVYTLAPMGIALATLRMYRGFNTRANQGRSTETVIGFAHPSTRTIHTLRLFPAF